MSGHGGGRAKECDGWEGGCGAGACAGGQGAGGVAVYAVSVFCCRLLLWSAGWDTRGRGSAEGQRMGRKVCSKRRWLSAPLVRFFALLFAPATHTARPDCS